MAEKFNGTPHNQAKLGDIAKTVLMPGDPLRAKFIAEKYLTDVRLVNTVRNMFAYTGKYKGKEVTIMGGGMGQPSVAIYSYELYKFYGVEQIIRIGTCGSYQPEAKVFDVIIAQGSSTNSSFAYQYRLDGSFSALADYDLLERAVNEARRQKVRFHVGNILSSDIFYGTDVDLWKKWAALGILGVEMESYALYSNAAYLHKKALAILTVSDSFISHEETTPLQREQSFGKMAEIALELI